eukprot:UN21327
MHFFYRHWPIIINLVNVCKYIKHINRRPINIHIIPIAYKNQPKRIEHFRTLVWSSPQSCISNFLYNFNFPSSFSSSSTSF